jgi:hypothetical protein
MIYYFFNASLNDDRSFSPEWGIVSFLMISKVIFKKLLAVAAIGASSVGYVAYQSSFGDSSGNNKGGDYEKMMQNMSMFSTAYISNDSNRVGINGKRKRGSSNNNDVSILGGNGRYDYSRIGKEP